MLPLNFLYQEKFHNNKMCSHSLLSRLCTLDKILQLIKFKKLLLDKLFSAYKSFKAENKFLIICQEKIETNVLFLYLSFQ